MLEETQVLNALAMEFICQLDDILKQHLLDILDRSGNFQIFCTSIFKRNQQGELRKFTILSCETQFGL